MDARCCCASCARTPCNTEWHRSCASCAKTLCHAGRHRSCASCVKRCAILKGTAPAHPCARGVPFILNITVHGPGQLLDRFPVSPSPEHKKSGSGYLPCYPEPLCGSVATRSCFLAAHIVQHFLVLSQVLLLIETPVILRGATPAP